MVNFEVNKSENSVKLFLNPSLYPLDVVYSTAYTFLDKYYVLLNGNPSKEVIVTIIPKSKQENCEKVGKAFSNELLTYSFYKVQSEKNSQIRQVLLQAALLPVEASQKEEEIKTDDDLAIEYEEKMSKADFFDDPEGIAVPWEVKYGKKNEREKKRSRKK